MCRRPFVGALIAFIVLLPGAFIGLPFGTSVVGADRLLAGEMPYADFWTVYAPGQYWLTAGLFAVLGRVYLVQAVAAIALVALSVGLLIALCRRVGASPRVGWAVAAVATGMLWRPGVELTSYVAALPCLLLGWRATILHLQDGGEGRLVHAGVWFGLAAVFKHDVGAYGAFAAGAGLVIRWACATTGRGRFPGALLLRLGAGCAAVVVPAMVVVGATAGAAAWECLIAFPTTVFPDVRGEPYPGLVPPVASLRAWFSDLSDLRVGKSALREVAVWAACNVPQVAWAAGVVVLIAFRNKLESWRMGVIGLALSGLPLFWMAAHVQQNTHLFSMGVLTFMLGALTWPAAGRIKRMALVGLFIIEAAGLTIPAALGAYAGGAERAPDLRDVAREVQERVPAGERILVSVARNDAPVIGAHVLHWLSERLSCTRWHEVHPGVTDRASVQREIIADAEDAGVRCVVVWRFGWSPAVMDRVRDRVARSTDDGGSGVLDVWIRKNFRSVYERGAFVVMWRR